MNLGVLETALLRHLRRELGEGIVWRRGPPVPGAEAGLLPEVFVHAQSLELVGPEPARQTLKPGWREQAAAQLELALSCRCGRHEQAQQLAGQVVAPALALLDRFETIPLDASGQLRLLRPAARLLRCASLPGDGDTALVQLQFQLRGVLETRLAPAEGPDPLACELRLRIEADPAGIDLKAERVRIGLGADEAPLSLGGWQLRDAAGHAFVFPPEARLAPGAELSLWTRRGKADAGNFYWNRRKAVWNNTGDVALLLDPQGREQARAHWQPPLPEPRKRR